MTNVRISKTRLDFMLEREREGEESRKGDRDSLGRDGEMEVWKGRKEDREGE